MSNIVAMSFTPQLYNIEDSKIRALLKPGDAYGTSGIVTNEKEVCYQQKESNCIECKVGCPLNRNPKNKES